MQNEIELPTKTPSEFAASISECVVLGHHGVVELFAVLGAS